MMSFDFVIDFFSLVKHTITNLPMLVRFMLLLTLFLVVPVISERHKIPGMVGLILTGMLFGPNGIDVWPDTTVIPKLFAEIGVLMVLFYAGMEIDLEAFKRMGGRATAFGLATLLLPLTAGAALGRLLGYGLNESLLIGSLIASHTLLGYPILKKLGLTSRDSVLVTISGTIFTDIVSLLILAVCVQIHRNGFNQTALGIQILEVVLCAVLILLGGSRVARHVMNRFSRSHETQMLGLLLIVFVCSMIAEIIELEPIVGAFLAGVAVSSSLRGTEARKHIEVIGNTLFVPAFFIMIGYSINPIETLRMLWENPVFSIGILLALGSSKFLAAWVVGWWSGYSVTERLMMWSLTLPQVAATIAATMVAHQTVNSAGTPLIDKPVVYGIFVVVMLTATFGPILTSRFGTSLSSADMAEESHLIDHEQHA